MQLEELRPSNRLRLDGADFGTIHDLKWFGRDAVSLVLEDDAGCLGRVLLCRADEPRLSRSAASPD
jgi:hypothetical protein